jgi:hypothetical protein
VSPILFYHAIYQHIYVQSTDYIISLNNFLRCDRHD